MFFSYLSVCKRTNESDPEKTTYATVAYHKKDRGNFRLTDYSNGTFVDIKASQTTSHFCLFSRLLTASDASEYRKS